MPEVKILALTVHEDKGYLHRLLQAGASGYVLKRAASVELIHAIRVVAAGRVYIDPTLAGKLVGDLVRRKPARGSAEGEVLSEREIEVVKLVAMGFNNREIAGRSTSASRRSRRTRPTRLRSSACTAEPAWFATPFTGAGCRTRECRLPFPLVFQADQGVP